MRNKLKFIEFMHTKKLDKRTLKGKKKKKKHRIRIYYKSKNNIKE